MHYKWDAPSSTGYWQVAAQVVAHIKSYQQVAALIVAHIVTQGDIFIQ